MRNLILLGISLLFGLLATIYIDLAGLWAYAFTLYSIDRINRYKNKDGWAHMAAAYIVGFEMLLRACHLGYVPYEFGKYAVFILLTLGMLVEKEKTSIPKAAIFYILLLLPSLFVVDFPDFERARNLIAFNLSGPASLFVSWAYFYKRKMNFDDLIKMFRMIVLGLSCYMARIVYSMPNLATYNFQGYSDHNLSGNFGPNQVAVAMALGFVVIGTALIIRKRIFNNIAIEIALCLLFVGFSILTFSRGGILSAFIALAVGAVIFGFGSSRISSFLNLMVIIGVLVVIGYISWDYVNSLTSNTLDNRYIETFDPTMQQHKGEIGVFVSGRDEIAKEDFELFTKYPILGVGPGMSVIAKEKLGMFAIVAHTELTRLLAEHGTYGLIALMILLFYPLRFYFGITIIEGRTVFAIFIILAIGTMLHAAMRMAIPGFLYGFAYLTVHDSHPNPLLKKVKRYKALAIN